MTMRPYKAYTGIFLFLLAVSSSPAADNSTYAFLRNDASARAAALGGSSMCIPDDPNGIFINPAIVGTIESRQVSFGFFKNIADINAGNASYGQRIENFGWIGAGVQYVNYGSFTRTDEIDNRLGTFSANDLAVLLNYSDEMYENLFYGVNAKFITSGIAEYRSSAVAFDLGLYYTAPEKLISFGVSAVNMGTQLDPYYDTRERLPFSVSAGVAKQLEHLPLLINLSFHDLNSSEGNFFGRFRAFSVGGEFTLSQYAKLRIGYNNQRRQDLQLGTSSGLAGFSLGGGILIRGYVVDYAFNSYGAIGATHRVSISTSF